MAVEASLVAKEARRLTRHLELTGRRLVDLPGSPAAGRPVRGSIRRAAAGRSLVHSRAAGSSMPYPLGGGVTYSPVLRPASSSTPHKLQAATSTHAVPGTIHDTRGIRRSAVP